MQKYIYTSKYNSSISTTHNKKTVVIISNFPVFPRNNTNQKKNMIERGEPIFNMYFYFGQNCGPREALVDIAMLHSRQQTPADVAQASDPGAWGPSRLISTRRRILIAHRLHDDKSSNTATTRRHPIYAVGKKQSSARKTHPVAEINASKYDTSFL